MLLALWPSGHGCISAASETCLVYTEDVNNSWVDSLQDHLFKQFKHWVARSAGIVCCQVWVFASFSGAMTDHRMCTAHSDSLCWQTSLPHEPSLECGHSQSSQHCREQSRVATTCWYCKPSWATNQLTSCHPIWAEAVPIDTTTQREEDWLSASVVNQCLVCNLASSCRANRGHC